MATCLSNIGPVLVKEGPVITRPCAHPQTCSLWWPFENDSDDEWESGQHLVKDDAQMQCLVIGHYFEVSRKRTMSHIILVNTPGFALINNHPRPLPDRRAWRMYWKCLPYIVLDNNMYTSLLANTGEPFNDDGSWFRWLKDLDRMRVVSRALGPNMAVDIADDKDHRLLLRFVDARPGHSTWLIELGRSSCQCGSKAFCQRNRTNIKLGPGLSTSNRIYNSVS